MRSGNKITAANAAVFLLFAVNQPMLAADQVSDGQWYHQFLNTSEAHQATQGEGVVVAIVDSGVDASHPDLAGSVLSGTDLSHEGPGDGRKDTNGHGTKMASLVAAHGRVRGVAPAARILPVRAGTGSGAGTSKVADGIVWAVAEGAKVISVSTGSEDDPLTRQAIQAALAADAVVVASVGNRPDDTSVLYPAAYPGVLAVAAVGKNGEHAQISVTGPQVVIAAPGTDVSGAHPGGRYSVGTGTSDATAIVAGAVALVRARFPQLKAADVVRRLTATAIDKGSPGRDPSYGFGVLNLVGALTAELPAATSPAVKESSAVSVLPPSTPDRFPWWVVILVAVPVVAAVIAAAVWSRRRGRVGW